MATISDLFPKGRKLSYDTRSLLNVYHSTTIPTSSSISLIEMTLSELENVLTLLTSLLLNEPPSSHTRRLWESKLEEVSREARDMRGEFDSVKWRRENEVTHRRAMDYSRARDRDDLFSGSASYNNSKKNDGDKNSYFDDMNEVNMLNASKNSLESSTSMITNLLSQGSETLSSLMTQRSKLKGVQRTVFNIANSLGVSRQTLRAIERREVSDRMLVYFGCFCILVLMYFLFLR